MTKRKNWVTSIFGRTVCILSAGEVVGSFLEVLCIHPASTSHPKLTCQTFAKRSLARWHKAGEMWRGDKLLREIMRGLKYFLLSSRTWNCPLSEWFFFSSAFWQKISKERCFSLCTRTWPTLVVADMFWVSLHVDTPHTSGPSVSSLCRTRLICLTLHILPI